jgi:nicotinate-nucleotide adenylyltransferase
MIIGPDRTLFFGGSFNPVHNAHLACSRAAAVAAGFGRVVLVPAHQPNLKDRAYDLAPAAHRVAMLERAARAASDEVVTFAVDPIELTRPGPSYTIDTAEALHRQGLSLPIDWLIGADQVLHLHRWHRFADLLARVRFWVMHRPGYDIDWDAVHSDARALRQRQVEVPQMDVSATDIRTRVRAGQPIDHLVPADVREYILAHRLYIP